MAKDFLRRYPTARKRSLTLCSPTPRRKPKKACLTSILRYRLRLHRIRLAMSIAQTKSSSASDRQAVPARNHAERRLPHGRSWARSVGLFGMLAAQAAGVDLDGTPIQDAPHTDAAAEAAVVLVREGKCEALMKGSLHTDELLRPVVARTGLRTSRRISHCFVLDVPGHQDPLIISDAAVNIAPTLA